MKPIFEPVRHLERDDKYVVGAGEGILYAPPFPLHPQAPGYWDAVHYHLYSVAPGFTFSILAGDGNQPIPLYRKRHEWTPGRIRVTYHAQGGIAVTEKKAASEWDTLLLRVSVRNLSPRRTTIRLVQWTSLPVDGSRSPRDIQAVREGVAMTVPSTGKHAAELGWALGMRQEPQSFAVQLCEGQPASWHANQPLWETTPFSERLRRSSSLGDGIRATGVSPDGLLYVGIERAVAVDPGAAAVFDLGLALGDTRDVAIEHLRRALAPEDPVQEADARWRRFFDEVPRLECSDEHILTAYWYRWFGLRLSSFSRPFRAYRHPAVCEGIEYFRSPISYSAQCHMREMRWHPDGAHARGSLLNFVEHQLADGSFPGHLHPHGPVADTFYHADWGDAALEVHAVHGDRGFLEAVYPALGRYAGHFDRDRDPQGTGLFDIFSQYETGQEYMSRYVAARPEEARLVAGWDRTLRIKGVDATVYAYRLKRALAAMAAILGRGADEVARWHDGAERIRQAMRERMWSPAHGMFLDLDPTTLAPTGAQAATCFYPYFTDIAGCEHDAGLASSLLDPYRFWTPHPVPASPVSDPLFDPEGLWQGKRHNCPWNGRVWPMTESHVAEALFHASHRAPALAAPARELFHKFIRLLFLDGDVARPACYEHYNPYTGQASLYRGIDDYMHSWVVDLILKHAAGLRPTLTGIEFDPRPLGIEWLRVSNARIRGQLCEVEIEKDRAVLRVDGATRKETTVG